MNAVLNIVLLVEFLFYGYSVYTYCESFFYQRRKGIKPLFIFLTAAVVNYAVYVLCDSIIINFIALPFLIFLACIISYRANPFYIFFHSVLLFGLFAGLELLTIPLINFFISENYFSTPNKTYEIISSTLTKLMFFLACKTINRFFRQKEKLTKGTILLFVPLISIILEFCYTSMNDYIDQTSYNIIGIILALSIILLNIIVFGVHDSFIKTVKENEKLKLLEQKKELNYEYYKQLQQSYDNTRIIAHDFKHHLSVITSLSHKGDSEGLEKCLESLDQNYKENSMSMTGNKIVDVVIAQKAEQCRMKGIDFIFHPNNTNLDFAEEVDICCILSNILDNAIEAAGKSVEKRIKMEFYSNEDDSIVFIETENSSDYAPYYKKGKLLSSKKDKNKHGIGMVSIENSLKKYKGEMDHKYSEETKVFTLSVMMHKA